MSILFEPLDLAHGKAMKNRFALAPMTNQQSHPDGRLSDEELNWLVKRASGGFALVMTAASHVQPGGQGFPGQLGIFSDAHLDGLSRLAEGIKVHGALAAVQLHHAGSRAPSEIVGIPVCPSDDPKSGARALTLGEVEQLRDAFIAGAKRADQAGFDGIEVHGAHGYILAEFLSPEVNRRDDRYGGNAENRARLLFEIIDGIRSACRPDFQVGLRLSPERYGQSLSQVRDLVAEVMRQGQVDYIDLSLWDVSKEAEDLAFRGQSLLSVFTTLPRNGVRLGAAGKVMSAQAAAEVLEAGCDFVVIGRAGILRHDFPERVRIDPSYASPPLPVSVDHLIEEGLSSPFISYMRSWPDFVAGGEADQ